MYNSWDILYFNNFIHHMSILQYYQYYIIQKLRCISLNTISVFQIESA